MVKPPAIPLATVISPTTKPAIVSLKVNVTGIGEMLVVLAEVLVIVTVGLVESNSLVKLWTLALGFEARCAPYCNFPWVGAEYV